MASSVNGFHDPLQPHLVQDGSLDFKGRPANRARTGGWKACAFIIGDELSERIAFYGIAANLVTYLTTELHEGLATAVKNTNNWVGVTTVIPVIGGFLADAYWGRYRAIAVFSVIYVVGLVFLTLSVSVASLKPPACATGSATCPKSSPAQVAFFFLALYLVSAGTGGVKPCLEAFGADQFDEEDPKERKRKSSFFNWWYFGLCTGGLFAVTVLVYIQDNVSWGLGFGIPAVAMAIALVLFLAGTPFYRSKKPSGSPLTELAQVLVAAIRNWDLEVPSEEEQLYESHGDESLRVGRRQLVHTPQLRFLDKAATRREEGDPSEQLKETRADPWKLCTVTQVEEAKLVVRLVPIWLTTFTYGVVFAQTTTFFTKQGATMNTHLGPHFKIPSASLQSFTAITVLLLLPIYDRLFVPLARRLTGHPRGIPMLLRIGLGLFCSLLSMAAAALTETKRLHEARLHGLLDRPLQPIPMTIFWLLPQYVLIGVGDVLALVGQQEFFYDQVPDTMKSLGMALYLGAIGVGSFLSTLIITIVDSVTTRNGHKSWIQTNLNRSHLDYFYWLLAVLSAINLALFILLAHFYHYKQTKPMDTMPPIENHAVELGFQQMKFHDPAKPQKGLLDSSI